MIILALLFYVACLSSRIPVLVMELSELVVDYSVGQGHFVIYHVQRIVPYSKPFEIDL
jgi:hypothetical protein